HKRADREVVPLNVRGAYRAVVYRAPHPYPLGADYFGRIVLQAGIAILLYDDAQIAVLAERQIDRLRIGREAIDRNLREAIATVRLNHVVRQLDHEPPRIVGTPLAEQVVNDEAAVLVLRRE